MPILIFVFFTILIFTIQTTILRYISIGGVKPDIILIVTVYVGLRQGKEKGISTGFIFGLIQDSLSAGIIGVNALSKGLLGFIVGNVREKIMSENMITQSLFIFIATIFDGLILLLISETIFQEELGGRISLRPLFLQALYSSIIGPLLFLVLKWIKDKYVLLKKEAKRSGYRTI